MVVIYHNRDLDGFCSGAISKLKYPEAKLIGYDYGEPFDIYKQIIKGEEVIMVDVSMSMEDMFSIAAHSGWNFTWIDHHISQIKEWEEFIKDGEIPWKSVLDNNISACEGIWKHLMGDQSIPEAVHWLGMYDTWKNEDEIHWETDILPFQYGMRALCNSPETFPTKLLLDSPPNLDHLDIREQGTAILAFMKVQNETVCKKACFEAEIDGLKAICANVSPNQFNSNTFESVWDSSKYDIMVPFGFHVTHWTVSMYSDKPEVDCSVIAKNRGGGGHKGAAEFQVDDITLLFPNTQI